MLWRSHRESKMKIATVGKGGSGKTTIAGLLARVLASRNQHILAIDGDPNPNLALTLGMSRADADRITYIPADLMRRVGEQDGVRTRKDLTESARIGRTGFISVLCCSGRSVDC